MKSLLLFYFLLIFCGQGLFSQTACSTAQLDGNWWPADTYIRTKETWTREKLDSLLNDSIKDKGWSWTFATARNTISSSRGKVTGYCTLDEKNCQLIMGHRKARRTNTWKIVFLDDKYLVMQIPNRHSFTTTWCRKKD